MKLLEVVYRSTLARVVCADFSGGLGVSRRRNGTIGTVSEVGCCYHRIGSEESTTEEQCVFVRRRKLQILTRRRGAWYLSATYDNEDDDDDIIRIQETTVSDDIASKSRAIITISLSAVGGGVCLRHPKSERFENHSKILAIDSNPGTPEEPALAAGSCQFISPT